MRPLHLPPDVDCAAQEVDVIDGQAENLALSQPERGARGEHSGRPRLADRLGDRRDLCGCPCECPGAQRNHMGHLRVSCRTDGCGSVWYRPRH